RSVKGIKRDEAEEKAAIGLQRVGLLRFAGRYPTELSGGQQQRVAIARALSLDPAGMVFHQPTAGPDPELGRRGAGGMRALAETGMTLAVVTHELNFAREVGDYLVFMDQGVIAESGPRGFLDECVNPRTRAFLSAVL